MREDQIELLKDCLENRKDMFNDSLKKAIGWRLRKSIELGTDFRVIKVRNGVHYLGIRGIIDGTNAALGFKYGALAKQALTRACSEMGVPTLEVY